MPPKPKSWKEKLHNGMAPKVTVTVKKFADVPEGVTMLIPGGTTVEEYIRNIPKGVHTSLQQMRKDIAADHNAQYSCPVVTGIFLRMAAEAAYEEYVAGKSLKKIIPFWRMIDGKAPVAKKLTFGTDFVREQRNKEGLAF